MEEGCCLEKIQIKNVRSLSDTGLVALPKVTLLVGENSSGKSTFLRTFPLIKQSISKRTNGPILWAGDVDDYVDFGSFSESISSENSNSMTFSFQFHLRNRQALSTRPSFVAERICREINTISQEDFIIYSFTVSQKDNREYVSQVDVVYNKNRFVFELSSDFLSSRIILNGKEMLKKDYRNGDYVTPSMGYNFNSIFNFVLPDISELIDSLKPILTTNKVRKNLKTDSSDLLSWYHPSVDSAISLIGKLLCKDLKLNDLILLSEEISQISLTFYEQWEKIIRKLKVLKEEKLEESLQKIMLIHFYDYFSSIENYLSLYFKQIHYIAPLRATAERYYRLRNLAIDEVDYQGKNLAIFLNGLSENRLQDFQKWTLSHFGFQTVVDKSGGHVSVKVTKNNSRKPINLSDSGFGYSQILPIVTQLWDLSTRKTPETLRCIPLVIAIEQPELHLHPALQAKLVETFAASLSLAEKQYRQMQLILETHSETIINHFGRMIAKGKLKGEDVSVLLFDRNFETGRTKVETSNFDQDGYLQNWPIGFFAP